MSHPAAVLDAPAPAGRPDWSVVIAELRAAVRGEVDDRGVMRAAYSSDASNYRLVPEVVIMPRTEADAIEAVRIAARHGVPVTPRGGGTSCAGNAVGAGIVIDFSRHMNRVLSVDPESRTAVVQPGVVLTDLQAAAAPHGLRFGPDPSTATRCTIGGMIGNNACGPHGLAYGRTADNVAEMRWLRADGTVIDAGSGDGALDVVPGLDRFVMEHLALLRTEFGRFDRQISGYSLEHLLPENGRNLAAALAGTEGTAGLILRATVKLVPKAAAPALAVLGYDDMPAAADDVPALLPFKPLALEGLDAQLVDVIRRAKGDHAVPGLPAGGGWLMIEVGGDTDDEARARAEALVAASASIDAQIYPAGPTATRLWQIRADGAGLAGRTAAGDQAWPGWEDSAVPPEHLGDYLRELNALMDSEGLSGLAYGHFGDGCIHLRIDFPLDSRPAVFRSFMERAAELVARYGGSLSGEHGDGRARSEMLPVIYSAEALAAMAEFKALMDPANTLNPGVVVQPDAVDDFLRRPQAQPLFASDGFRFDHDGGDITKAIHRCVGVGKCRADNRVTGGFMCPSYTATRDEKDSTRGRARVLQEMLNGGVVTERHRSPEVHEALDLCLSCKACANDCPTGIDMATFKSEVLHQSYKGRIRPLSHYTLGRLPQWLRLMGPFTGIVNLMGRIPPIRRLMMHMIGADPRRGLPLLPPRPFHRTPEAKRLLAASGRSGTAPSGTANLNAADASPASGLASPADETHGCVCGADGCGGQDAGAARDLAAPPTSPAVNTGADVGAPSDADPAIEATTGAPTGTGASARDGLPLVGTPRGNASGGGCGGSCACGSSGGCGDGTGTEVATHPEIVSALAAGAPARTGAPVEESGSSTALAVTLWVDSFTDTITPKIAADAIRVLRASGADVELAEPGACCGLTLISTGQLTAAKARLRRTVDTLAPAVRAGRVIVGLEPSCTATLRSDLVELLGDEPGAKALAGRVQTVAEFLNSTGWTPPVIGESLLVQPHCHHYAIMGYREDQQLLERMGCEVEISAGCCGLAGNFGMEKGHYEVSRTIAEQGILARAAASPTKRILADGFSCRTQINDLQGLNGSHLVELIAEHLPADPRD